MVPEALSAYWGHSWNPAESEKGAQRQVMVGLGMTEATIEYAVGVKNWIAVKKQDIRK